MPNLKQEIHVNDTTTFKMRTYDNGVDFDPTTATTKELIFLLPGGNVITKTATLEPVGSPATYWYLTYDVVPGDGLGSPPGEFNATPGKLKVQFYLEWAGGASRFHSSEQSTDAAGVELRVFSNLDD